MIKNHGYTKYVRDRCRCQICIDSQKEYHQSRRRARFLPRPPMICHICNIRYRDHPIQACIETEA